MALDLVIGAPIFERAYILNDYFDALEAQDLPAATRFVFAVTPGRDSTERIIQQRCPQAEILLVTHFPAFTDSERDDIRRYAVLAQIRNLLLRRVAALAPAHYWSLDSDILMAPDALRELLAVNQDAVGGLVDMGGDAFPGSWSYMLDLNSPYRPSTTADGLPHGLPHGPPFPVDIIMGCVLMTERAYRNVRYADHIEGEDCGWAIQAEAMGVQRWIAPKARGEHRWRLPESTPPTR